MEPQLLQITAQFKQIGINLSGVAAGKQWQDILPRCQSVFVFGSGGPRLWNHFLRDLKRRPHLVQRNSHPLDNFVKKKLREVDPQPPKSRLWVRCAANEKTFVDFKVLAHQAGLGWSSKLGILINKTYGLWFGIRLACFTTELINPTGPLLKPGPCDTCNDFNCVTKCPGEAISTLKGWNLDQCVSFQNKKTTCQQQCPSRLACPISRAHTYSEVEQNYHHQQSLGRVSLNNFLKDPGD